MNIETVRLIIEPFVKEKHLTGNYVGWLQNPENTRFSDQRFQLQNIDSCSNYIDWMDKQGNILLAIVDKQSKTHIGNIGLQFNRPHETVDVSILIGEVSYKTTGRAFEAWNAVLSELVKRKAARKITAGTLAVNKAMHNLMEKSGMVPDGIRKKHQIFEGKAVDVIYYAVFCD